MDELIREKIGFFRGFSESGLEFKADIVTPYHTENHPVIGTFLLVSIDKEKVILGRVTKFFPLGVMSSSSGEDYLAQMGRLKREIPEDLKESKLRYNVNVKLLGLIKSDEKKKYSFSPSIRRLPHLGAWVGVPTEKLLEYICNLGVKDDVNPAVIGHLSFGDQVYDGQVKSPTLPVSFGLNNLIARRTFVFARAGYGKSNLIKLLISRLYEKTQPGGMIIFDPEGEYAFKDEYGRYGLLDVPNLKDKIVVYTDRNVSDSQKRWVAGNVRLNLGHLKPSSVVNIGISSQKQDTVFANVLRGMRYNKWKELLETIERDGYSISDELIMYLTVSTESSLPQSVKNNLIPLVKRLHSSNSTLLAATRQHLKEGRIVIVDVSLMSSGRGEELAGLVLDALFTKNQENFTEGSGEKPIPIISVIEEAQSVLSPKSSDTSPFVVWAKEGREYGLGSILITQQPGAISKHLLSQGDNFFSFHLVSEHDLRELQKVNAHFSNDILSAILNEPIKGNAYFWSAPDQPFVMGTKIENFQEYVETLNKDKKSDVVEDTPAEEFSKQLPDLEKKLDASVREGVIHKPNVKLYDNVIMNGSKNDDVVAVYYWNIKFGLTGTMGPDLERIYCEKPFEDKGPVITDDSLFESLGRLGLLSQEGFFADGNKKKYLLLKKKAFRDTKKMFDKNELRLTSY